MKILVSALSAGLLLVSCVSYTPQTRIQQNPRMFSSLSAKDQDLVQRGLIARGMTPDAVFLAWGKPTAVMVGSRNNKNSERWDYAGARPVYTSSFYGSYGTGGYHGRGGYGYSGFGFGMGPDVAYVPHRLASVWFINHTVDAWEREQ